MVQIVVLLVYSCSYLLTKPWVTWEPWARRGSAGAYTRQRIALYPMGAVI